MRSDDLHFSPVVTKSQSSLCPSHHKANFSHLGMRCRTVAGRSSNHSAPICPGVWASVFASLLKGLRYPSSLLARIHSTAVRGMHLHEFVSVAFRVIAREARQLQRMALSQPHTDPSRQHQRQADIAASFFFCNFLGTIKQEMVSTGEGARARFSRRHLPCLAETASVRYPARNSIRRPSWRREPRTQQLRQGASAMKHP